VRRFFLVSSSSNFTVGSTTASGFSSVDLLISLTSEETGSFPMVSLVASIVSGSSPCESVTSLALLFLFFFLFAHRL